MRRTDERGDGTGGTAAQRTKGEEREKRGHERSPGSALHYDATVRALELLGEVATHLPEGVRGANPQVPWRMITATRNRLLHGYLGIDDDTLWSIVRGQVPELLNELRTIDAGLGDAGE